jgi:hypothetical protein
MFPPTGAWTDLCLKILSDGNKVNQLLCPLGSRGARQQAPEQDLAPTILHATWMARSTTENAWYFNRGLPAVQARCQRS